MHERRDCDEVADSLQQCLSLEVLRLAQSPDPAMEDSDLNDGMRAMGDFDEPVYFDRPCLRGLERLSHLMHLTLSESALLGRSEGEDTFGLTRHDDDFDGPHHPLWRSLPHSLVDVLPNPLTDMTVILDSEYISKDEAAGYFNDPQAALLDDPMITVCYEAY